HSSEGMYAREAGPFRRLAYSLTAFDVTVLQCMRRPTSREREEEVALQNTKID
ncbi:unnamed protein product, partial [Acanthocheilonema viteae]